MRLRAIALAIVTAVVVGVPASGLPLAADPPHVLVWTGTYGFRHPSITDAQLAFVQMAQTGGFTVEITENPADLSALKLAGVDVLAWVSTTGKPPMTEQQRSDVMRWAACGGGTIAFHAAADANYGWAEHAELLGAQFDSHPYTGTAKMNVEDNTHPITAGWKDVSSFSINDEWYRWRAATRMPGISLPRDLPGTHVLLSLEETTVPANIQNGATAYEDDQPIAWTKTFRGGGRVYYNNMGHSSGTWGVPEFRTSIVNGIGWVSEKRPDMTCVNSSTPLPPPTTPPAADLLQVGKACTLPDRKTRSGGTWETSGAMKRLTEAGDSMVMPSAGIPGNLGWGAQHYVLDLSASKAKKADVTLTLSIPTPTDDYDLSVTTAWGWYGSHALPGAASEQLVLEDIPHCAILQVYGDNLLAASQRAPSLTAVVAPAPVTAE